MLAFKFNPRKIDQVPWQPFLDSFIKHNKYNCFEWTL